MIDKEKIKEEIERRIKSMNSCPFKTAELGSEKFDEGELYAYKQILQFIDSLESFPEESASEDLEEKITKCYKSRNDLMMTKKQFGELIHRFTEWQKQKDFEELSVNNFDWQSFRNQAAKDILCSLIHKTDNFIGKDSASYAIMIADELIKQLKKGG